PSINDVAKGIIQSMGKTERFDGVPDSLIVVDAYSVTAAADMYPVVGLGVHLYVKEFRAETPMRIFGRKPEGANTVIGRAFKIPTLERPIVKGKIGPAI